MNDVPPSNDEPDELDEQYRRAARLAGSRPSEAVRRAILEHAAQRAALHAAAHGRPPAANDAVPLRRKPATLRSRWPLAVFGSLAAVFYAIPKAADVVPDPKKEKIAFVASALYIVGMLVGAAFALYPVVLPSSSDPARNLTIYNTAAGHHGLTVGITWWILGMILASGYFVFLFRMFKGKVRLDGEGY